MIFLLGIPLMFVTVPLYGLVVARLWQWFVVTQFHVAALSVPEAAGLGILVGLMAHQHIPRDEDKSDTERFIAAITYSLVGPALALLFGWFIKAVWL